VHSSPKPQVDTSRPHSARVYDFLLGGKDHYLVDRELAESLPDAVRSSALQNRDFMHRAVAWAAREGVDQYLDIGTGIPTEPNLHQIVQGIIPSARVVYVDNDPIVLRHAEALLVSSPEGATGYIDADVREPSVILERARAVLDFGRPVALSLVALMHFVLDEDDPYGIVRTLVGALHPGSCLIMVHGSMDGNEEQDAEIESTYRSSIRSQARTRAEILRFFDGLDLVEPGLVPAPLWYKDGPAPEEKPFLGYVGVARVR
jgi:S-adenosyl methyltransferase